MNATVLAAPLAPNLTLPWPLPPVLFADSPNAGPGTGGNLVTLTGLGLNAATQVHFGETLATIVAGDVLGFSLVVVAPPGKGTVAVTVTTPNGTSNPVAYTYLVASPPPVPSPTTITPASGPTAGGTVFVITGAGLAGASVTFGGTPATVLASTANVIAGLTPAHAVGNVPVVVTTAGGSASVPGGFTYLLPPVPVVTAAITPSVSIAAGGGVFTIVGTNLTGATVTFGSTAATVTANTGTVITGIIPAGTAGTTVNVTVTTPGGTASAGTMTYVGVPVVTAAITPSVSIPAGGGVFTIAGTGLTGATVTFGSTTATLITNTDTLITGTIPIGTPATTVNVTVTTPGGTASAGTMTYTA
ncbi:IPT/TIG domain-containing protein [Kitasatospora sp. NPDC056531]|uniref:IPT/TIG domain-containing protein n=1 Tax=Kitasatospora sp. NPDC056531 TaxID=3345856 RepID=UPI0036B4FF4E